MDITDPDYYRTKFYKVEPQSAGLSLNQIFFN